MTLCSQVVYLVWLNLLHDSDEIGRIGKIPIMQDEMHVALVWILVQVINPVGIERGRTALHAVDDITFFQQEFGEVSAILPCNACYEGDFLLIHWKPDLILEY